ncbi:hypothetical protein ABZ079_08270 [Streptomyces sp. NPDC006314]|uniref:hypothetical protein n=1 Tax=Streptomyces sp. NPDC006314 TaxID=3154475 RepID=UPI0033A921FA
MNLTAFLLALGATCRITRFLTKDTLAAGLRSQVADRFGDDSKAAYLVSCGWCASVWVATAMTVYALALADNAWFKVPAIALSLSYLAGVASRWLD